jgi:hypothetical protein
MRGYGGGKNATSVHPRQQKRGKTIAYIPGVGFRHVQKRNHRSQRSSPPPNPRRKPNKRKSKAMTRPAYEVLEVPAVVRDGIRAGLTPDQIYARNGKRRAVYLAAIVEETREVGELATYEPTPSNVELLRDRHGHRWERIAVRVFGDPRRTRQAMDLYDEAKGKEGAAQESYTGRGRRFPKMKP